MTTRKFAMLGLAIGASALIVAGCGSSGESDPAGAPDATELESEVPESSGGGDAGGALEANRAQANEILDEGQLEPKLQQLEGNPVVVNQWASWCEPCRAEFPYFQAAAETYESSVGFVGIDMQDDRAAAEAFLADLPVPYPSIDDPEAEQIRSLGGGVVSPTTVFIDEKGEIVATFQGVYTSQEQLNEDIERHLLG